MTAEATKRRRMPSMGEAMKQATKLGLTVISASASVDGWSLTFANGQDAQPSSSNVWDEVLKRDAH
jgi:hypothetical protein